MNILPLGFYQHWCYVSTYYASRP